MDNFNLNNNMNNKQQVEQEIQDVIIDNQQTSPPVPSKSPTVPRRMDSVIDRDIKKDLPPLAASSSQSSSLFEELMQSAAEKSDSLSTFLSGQSGQSTKQKPEITAKSNEKTLPAITTSQSTKTQKALPKSPKSKNIAQKQQSSNQLVKKDSQLIEVSAKKAQVNPRQSSLSTLPVAQPPKQSLQKPLSTKSTSPSSEKSLTVPTRIVTPSIEALKDEAYRDDVSYKSFDSNDNNNQVSYSNSASMVQKRSLGSLSESVSSDGSNKSKQSLVGPRAETFKDGPSIPRKQTSPPKMTSSKQSQSKENLSRLMSAPNQQAQASPSLKLNIGDVDLDEMPEVSLPGFTPFVDQPAKDELRSVSRLSNPQQQNVGLLRRISMRIQGKSPISPQPKSLSALQQDLESNELRRRSSLSKPERSRQANSMRARSVLLAGGGIAADSPLTIQRNAGHPMYSHGRRDPKQRTWWTMFSSCVTFYAPDVILDKYLNKKTPEVRRAWREKMGLVTIIVMLCVLLGFITFGFQYFSCGFQQEKAKTIPFGQFTNSVVNIRGKLYNISQFQHPGVQVRLDQVGGRDVSWLFPLPTDGNSACNIPGVQNVNISCNVEKANVTGYCHNPTQLQLFLSSPGLVLEAQQSFNWSFISTSSRYIVFSGAVLDLKKYFDEGKDFLGTDFTKFLKQYMGKDVSNAVRDNSDYFQRMLCLQEQFVTGFTETQPIGCLAASAFTYLSLGVILAVIVIKFCLAVLFLWTTGRKLGTLPDSEILHGNVAQVDSSFNDNKSYHESGIELSPAVVQALNGKKQGAIRNSLSLPTKSRFSNQYNLQNPAAKVRSYRPSPLSAQKSQTSSVPANTEYPGILRTIMLVTCYSEDEASLRIGLNSLAKTDFPDTHKLLFIIADGIVTGSGNDRSTPEILIDMIELDQQFSYPPLPYSYVAIADGSKRHNMAQVYAGRYKVDGHSVPVVLVVKCGTPEEKSERKPGNRGKRDSQILIMNFLSKVLFNDRMTPLEYDLFTKMTAVASSSNTQIPLNNLDVKITPDMFELVLMVDADTQVQPNALTPMSYAMANDPKLIGLCGETQISNKSESFWTAIQVFEYYLAHFLGKAFESVFGSVTCLPGCFCMYRVKAPKGDSTNPKDEQYFVPILANPDIVEAYSENVVETLHAKNLLLLGEDRYLTTLMLKTFPKRKLMFLPKAKCQTEAPNSFKVLLSQRRRWINSTIHNLLELVLVRDLCGIFCFSMQFVIFMELIGTFVLPAAITFTIYLIIISFFVTPPPLIPLFLLLAILGSPALLIVLTSRKRYSYLGWMLIYLVSLPIWNFVLPVYSYMHFDDFSWGSTRQVQGGDQGHGESEGQFDPSKIVMKKWSEWEKERFRAETIKRLNGKQHVRRKTTYIEPAEIILDEKAQSTSNETSSDLSDTTKDSPKSDQSMPDLFSNTWNPSNLNIKFW